MISALGINRLAKLCMVGLLAFGLVAATGTAAQAHYVYDSHWEYRSHDVCIHHRVETSHGSGGGYSQTQADTWGYNILGGPLGDCNWQNDYPAGYITQDMYFYIYWHDEWLTCKAYDWNDNSVRTAIFRLEADYGKTPPCGNGWYGTDSMAFVKFNNEWKGGGPLYSGAHKLPDNDLVGKIGDMTGNEPQSPLPGPNDRVGVAGPDGQPLTDEDGNKILVSRAELHGGTAEPPAGELHQKSEHHRSRTVTDDEGRSVEVRTLDSSDEIPLPGR